MKKLVKVSLLALAATAGGIFAASAAATPEVFTAYNLDIRPTNAEAAVWSVSGLPRTTNASLAPGVVFFSSGGVTTFADGKIIGSGAILITNPAVGNVPSRPVTVLWVDLTGRISSSPAHPTTVTLQMRGQGVTIDGTGGATATPNTATLKFVGTAGLDLNAPITGDLSVRITGDSVLGATRATATFTGAQVSSSGSFINVIGTVAQSQRRIFYASNTEFGNGTVNSTTSKYKLNTRGIGFSRGRTLAISGDLADHANAYLVGTNAIPTTNTLSSPSTVFIKGRDKGQAVATGTPPVAAQTNNVSGGAIFQNAVNGGVSANVRL